MTTLNELSEQVDAIRAEETAAIEEAYAAHRLRIESSEVQLAGDEVRIRAEFKPRIESLQQQRDALAGRDLSGLTKTPRRQLVQQDLALDQQIGTIRGQQEDAIAAAKAAHVQRSRDSSALFVADKKRIRAEFAPRIEPIVRTREAQYERERGGDA